MDGLGSESRAPSESSRVHAGFLDNPQEQFADWCKNHNGEEDEFIPLFWNEAHADLCFGDEKGSFMLKSWDSM